MHRGASAAIVAALIALALAGCGDDEGTGEQVDSASIEDRIAIAVEAQDDYSYEYDVRCEDPIEAGTDFGCFAYPVGLDGAALNVTGHLDADGETIGTIETEPTLRDPPTDPTLSP